MNKLIMKDNLEFSQFALGFWRLREWGMNLNELKRFVEDVLELGITTFDHADIYGSYTCEEEFGKLLKEEPSLREKIQLVTKCGIKLVSPQRPENTFHAYDTSKEHILNSVDTSLKNMNTDYLDVLLIHRRDFIMNADEVAEAFYALRKAGKVLHFGVSNFHIPQIELLQSRLDFPLVTNQIELNILNMTHSENGDLDYLQKERITPMIWSPLAGGRIFTGDNEQINRIRFVLGEIKEETGYEYDQILLAWILAFPVNPQIVLGSGKSERIKSAVKSAELKLTKEQWYRLWTASHGYEIP